MLHAMPKAATAVNLNDTARQQLEQWVAAHATPQQVALRCRIVLAAAAGANNVAIAKERDVDVKTVALWRKRFAQVGAQGLWEIAPGRWRDALELPYDGGNPGRWQRPGEQHLAHPQHQAPP
jgi:hypothetical protein